MPREQSATGYPEQAKFVCRPSKTIEPKAISPASKTRLESSARSLDANELINGTVIFNVHFGRLDKIGYIFPDVTAVSVSPEASMGKVEVGG